MTTVPLLQDHVTLAELWTDLIEWPKRLEKEGPFLTRCLNEHKCHYVFDACLGDGIDSIFLLKQGFSVVSNELDEAFRKKAGENAAKNGVILNLTLYDWRELDQYMPDKQFDAIICLGNSFTYLFDLIERNIVLQNFYSLLKPGGILIIDERNYPYMLKNRGRILREGFKTSSKRVVYCGEKVVVKPVSIEYDMVIMNYKHKEMDQEGYLSLYPFKKDELRLLLESYFDHLGIFSDYEKGYDSEASFFQHLCVKL